MENLVANKSDCITVHGGTNDMTNDINSLNSVKKIIKQKNSSNMKLVFTSMLPRKDKRGISKKVTDNQYLTADTS